MHTRLRVPMLNRIGKGNFDRAIQIIMEKMDKFDPSTLDHIFPLSFDVDPLNKQRRKLVYKQKKEILNKIATMSKEASLTILTDSDGQERRKVESQLTWDLSLDYDREWIPDEILSCLRFTIYSHKQKLRHLPKFLEFYKDGSMLMVKYNHLPIRLRDIIGKRNEMFIHGSKIIKLLLQGLRELKEHGIVVNNIQPSSIFLNEDYSELIFSDIKYMSKGLKKSYHSITTAAPYSGSHGIMKEREAWESQTRDIYSIGIVILEILVGTEMVIMAKNPIIMSKLIGDLEDYLNE
jgi:serine/threonine protein kinase